MAIKVKVKMNLNFPDLILQDELLHIANKVIINDIGGKMGTGVNISGQGYGPLDPKTIKQKQKKGFRTNPLIASGQLRRSFRAVKSGENAVKISPEGMRYSTGSGSPIGNNELGDILQNKGVRTKYGKRFFEFFGISKEAEIEAMDYMNKTIKKRIRDGGRKFVR